MTAIASALVQWLLWGSALAGTVLVASRLARWRRADLADAALRASIALQAALLAASIVTTSGDDRVSPGTVRAQAAAAGFSPGPQTLSPREVPPVPAIRATAVRPTTTPSPTPLRISLIGPRWAIEAGLLIWALGVLAGLGRIVLQVRRVAGLVAAARPAHGQCARVPMLESPLCGNVFLVGWRRPAIVLPAGLAERLAPQELAALGAHELAHLRRRDMPWMLAARLAALLAWPLPFGRWVAREMGRTAEVLCDREAVAGAREPPAGRPLARAILEVLKVRTGLPAAPLAAAVPSPSFARRRIEMLLADDRPVPAGALRKFAAAALAAVIALPLLLLQVRCSGTPRAEPSSQAAAGVREDPAKVERERQIRAAAAEGIVAGGAAAYRAGDIDKARDFFARAMSDLEPRIHPVTDTRAFLPLGKHPLLVPAVEKEFGKLSAGGPGTLVDAGGGYAVIDRGLAERIAAAYLPVPTEKDVFIESAFIKIRASTAREWSKRLTGDAGPRDWVHPWIGVDLYRGDGQVLRSNADFITAAKSEEEIRVLATPLILSHDRTESTIFVGAYQPIVEDQGPGKQIFVGLSLRVWPRIEGDQVRLLLDGSNRELEAGGHEVVDTARWEFDLTVPDGGEGTVLGRAPSDGDVAKGGDLTWLWVRAKATAPNTSLKDLVPGARGR